MTFLIVVYSIASLVGVYSAIASLARYFGSQGVEQRRKAVFSMVSSFVFLSICGVTIYLSLNAVYSSYSLAIFSCFLIGLNELVHWKLLRT